MIRFLNIRKLKEYQPVTFNERVDTFYKILINNIWINCTLKHVLYEPMLVQISISDFFEESELNKNSLKIFSFTNPKKVNATLELQHIKTIEIESEKMFLFEVVKTKLHINFMKILYLKRIYRLSRKKNANFLKEFNFAIYKKLVGLFSIPKQVWLVSINNKEETHFPIDLCAINKSYISIGVRNTNHSINKLHLGSIFILSKTAAEDYKKVYSLGKFSQKIKPLNTIKVDEILLPNIICGYYKLELSLKVGFENQTVYISKIIHQEEVTEIKKPLFHLHKIWLLNNSNSIKI